jgi:hypothetical protein
MVPSCDFKVFEACIHIGYKNNLIVVTLRSANDYCEVRTNLSDIKLVKYRKNFYKGLERFLEQSKLKKGWGFQRKARNVSHPLRCLHEIGRIKYDELFDDRRSDVDDFFKKVCLNWRQSHNYNNYGYRPPFIRVESELNYPLPWEFFPVFDTSEPSSISNTNDLFSVAARFLGFSTIISREFTNHPPVTDTILENGKGLRVRFFQNVKLPCARLEHDFFASKKDWFELQGPWWPDDTALNTKQFVSELATQLWNPSAKSRKTTKQDVDQIHHFACHCNTDKESSEDYEITLACKSNWLLFPAVVRRANIRDLRAKFSQLPRSPVKATPLVFLNACGTSKMTPEGVNSFPAFFIQRVRSRAMIGTETPIPDRFAAEFSKQFYLNLIQGKSLGEALYGARWYHLTERNNPLGILYSVYGNAHLRVRKPYPKAQLGRTEEAAVDHRI